MINRPELDEVATEDIIIRAPRKAADEDIPVLALTQLSNYLTLKGSFSAVSKPNFASKYALESSRRDLQNALLCTVLAKLNFLFENHYKKFAFFCQINFS